jgi:hypothetical protein
MPNTPLDAGSLLAAILPKLDRGGSPDRDFPDRKGEYWALCPFHADTHPTNFSVSEKGFKCFACNAQGGLRKLAEKLGVDRLTWISRGSPSSGPDRAPCDPLPPTLENYARVKGLPVPFLESLGLRTVNLHGKPSVRMPYYDAGGNEVACRFRIAFARAATGPDSRFRWRSCDKVIPYGLWRLDRQNADVILCEGESDAQTFWFHDIPALGIPGAGNWKPEWVQPGGLLAGLAGLTVYVWRESDRGGETFAQRVAESLPDCRILTPPQGRKDISDCLLAGDDVPALVARLKANARAWRALQAELEAERLNAEAGRARQQAAALLAAPDILEEFGALCRTMGLVGEERTVKLLYLAVTSRLLERPISVVVKGPSSGGKSYTVESVLKSFPPSAYHALSALSAHALAYSEEPLAHRMLVLFEAAGMTSDISTYFIRSLLSEGCIRYETVEPTTEGLKPRLIERAGPTGLIVTTTQASLHPENETRMFSVTVRDDPEQTAGVLQSLADRANPQGGFGPGPESQPPDFTPWHALQRWLELAGCRAVTIPFAHDLAARADTRAVRLRRDFGATLSLVRAHALLHQGARRRDDSGRIIATLDDYAAVYDLVIDIIAQSVQATVSATIRETVAAVKELDKPNDPGIKLTALARALGIDKSAALRRVRVAIEDGYLTNLEDRKGRPARITLGDPLPEDRTVLPHPVTLATGG